jgi:hypothetical protein
MEETPREENYEPMQEVAGLFEFPSAEVELS